MLSTQDENRNWNLSQGRIINPLNRYLRNSELKNSGIELDEEGICAALVVLWLLEKTKGKEVQFFDGQKQIVTFQEKNIEEKSFMADSAFKARYAFYPADFKHGTNQGDMDKIFKSHNIDIVKTFANGIQLDTKKAVDYFRAVIAEGQMCYLAANKHAIGVYKKGDVYYVYDPNHKKYDQIRKTNEVACKTIEDATKEILKMLFVKPSDISVELKFKSFQYNLPDLCLQRSAPKIPALDKNQDEIELLEMVTDDPGCLKTMHAAAIAGDTITVKKLLKHKVNPYIVTPGKNTSPLECAWGNSDIVRLMLEHITPTTDQVLAPLLSALYVDDKEVVDQLFEHIRITDLTQENLDALFCAAAVGGRVESMKTIVELNNKELMAIGKKGKNISDKGIESAIKAAAKNNRYDVLEYFYKHVIYYVYDDKNKIKPLYEQAIHESIKAGHYNCYNKLLALVNPATKNKSEIEAEAIVDERYLLTAVVHGQERIALDLLNKGVENKIANLKSTPTLIQFAASEFNLSLIKKLLSKKEFLSKQHSMELELINLLLNVDPKNKLDFFTVYNTLTEKSNIKFILLSNKEFLNNLWFAALLEKNEELANKIKLFIGIQVQSIDVGQKSFVTQLAKACHEGDFALVKLLIDNKIPANKIVTFKGKETTPLLLSFELYPEIALYLIQQKQYEAAQIGSLLKIACVNRYLTIIETLINDNNQYINAKIDSNQTLLDVAVKYHLQTTIELLLKKGADIAQCENHGKSFIMKLCQAGKLNLIKLAMTSQENNVKDAITVQDVEKEIPLLTNKNAANAIECFLAIHVPSKLKLDKFANDACLQGKDEVVDVLIAKGATLDKQTFDLLFKKLIDQDKADKLQNYLKIYKEIHKSDDLDLDLLLANACAKSACDAVEVLLQAGAKFTISDNNIGMLCLAYNINSTFDDNYNCKILLKKAKQFGHQAIHNFVSQLQQKYAKDNVLNSPRHISSLNMFAFDPLESIKSACSNGDLDCIKKLVASKKINLNDLNKLPLSPLEIACNFGYSHIIKYFLEMLSPQQMAEKIELAIATKSFKLIAAILEFMPREDLMPKLQEKLLQPEIRSAIRKAWNEEHFYKQDTGSPKYSTMPALPNASARRKIRPLSKLEESMPQQSQSSTIHHDSKERLRRVVDNECALGIILHSPVKEIAKPSKK